MIKHKLAVTLIELLIAISLLGLLVVGISSLDTYARYHLVSSDRRAQLQNEVSYVLEHMAKNISRGIGDANWITATTDPTVEIQQPAGQWITVWVDTDENSRFEPNHLGGQDFKVCYVWTSNATIPYYTIFYCPSCLDGATDCDFCAMSDPISSSRITNWIVTYDDDPSDGNLDNFVEVEITACWDPDGVPEACGTLGNPESTMQARIKMPAVSVN